MTKSLSQHRAAVDSAAESLRAGRRALLDANGQRIFSDAEHQRREDALRAAFKNTITDAASAAQTAALEAEAVLSQGDQDPVHKLTTAEMERASLLKSLLREKLLTVPIRDVDAEVQAVLRDGDRAARYATWALVSERRQARVAAAVDAAPDLSARPLRPTPRRARPRSRPAGADGRTALRDVGGR